MKRICWFWTGMAWVLTLVAVTGGVALADDAAKSLAGAKRLVCAFTQGSTAGFTPNGKASVRPALDPTRPGLAISLTDREKNRAVLEEDDEETAGVLLPTASGLSVAARFPDGGVSLVTVYPLFAGGADNFLMVASRHGAGLEPHMTQRYGLCRLASEKVPPAPPVPPAAPHK